ncbi:hypothetical protein CPT03_14570 [Pedobacter ginsengisoli]|uniref:Uncharacterized protein n=2 Tax=Pedobacter ginsengisoli TaxID=363852 RepID=A0A2D1U7Q6_9SPHI|nr:hypothetical protein CPT03_14570 [Pedobacter ginsengisoli]
MREGSKPGREAAVYKLTYIQQVPKKKMISQRKKIRQLLRSMLPMGKEERQYQEERRLFHKQSKAQ